MTSDHGPPKDKPPESRAAEREAKLGQALRANLRRRKMDVKARAAKPEDGEST